MHNRFRTSKTGAGAASGGKARALAVMMALAVGLGGCAYALPSFPIPDLIRDPRKLMTKEEQQRAINDLTDKKEAQQAAIAKQAEKSK